ncbi:hypothetical protein evm_015297 [Chilo suppressalis]|nr:hypothetical protein evm_015297 [Chilo suppressalis]
MSSKTFTRKKNHADQAADGTRTRTLRNPGECTDQLCYHGYDGRVEIFLVLSCKAAPSPRIVGPCIPLSLRIWIRIDGNKGHIIFHCTSTFSETKLLFRRRYWGIFI